jgi:hypothetical protein
MKRAYGLRIVGIRQLSEPAAVPASRFARYHDRSGDGLRSVNRAGQRDQPHLVCETGEDAVPVEIVGMERADGQIEACQRGVEPAILDNMKSGNLHPAGRRHYRQGLCQCLATGLMKMARIPRIRRSQVFRSNTVVSNEHQRADTGNSQRGSRHHAVWL